MLTKTRLEQYHENGFVAPDYPPLARFLAPFLCPFGILYQQVMNIARVLSTKWRNEGW